MPVEPATSSEKAVALDALQRMPDSATLEDICEELAILAAIRRGEADLAAGRVVGHEEVKEEVGGMDFEIDWTEGAAQDFEDTVRYVARHNVPAADQLRLDLLEALETLSRFPFIGHVYERDRSGRTRETGCRGYRIFYRVEQSDRRVRILVIRHGSRQEPRLP